MLECKLVISRGIECRDGKQGPRVGLGEHSEYGCAEEWLVKEDLKQDRRHPVFFLSVVL
jgi:hypothetical protein